MMTEIPATNIIDCLKGQQLQRCHLCQTDVMLNPNLSCQNLAANYYILMHVFLFWVIRSGIIVLLMGRYYYANIWSSSDIVTHCGIFRYSNALQHTILRYVGCIKNCSHFLLCCFLSFCCYTQKFYLRVFVHSMGCLKLSKVLFLGAKFAEK